MYLAVSIKRENAKHIDPMSVWKFTLRIKRSNNPNPNSANLHLMYLEVMNRYYAHIIRPKASTLRNLHNSAYVSEITLPKPSLRRTMLYAIKQHQAPSTMIPSTSQADASSVASVMKILRTPVSGKYSESKAIEIVLIELRTTKLIGNSELYQAQLELLALQYADIFYMISRNAVLTEPHRTLTDMATMRRCIIHDTRESEYFIEETRHIPETVSFLGDLYGRTSVDHVLRFDQGVHDVQLRQVRPYMSLHDEGFYEAATAMLDNEQHIGFHHALMAYLADAHRDSRDPYEALPSRSGNVYSLVSNACTYSHECNLSYRNNRQRMDRGMGNSHFTSLLCSTGLYYPGYGSITHLPPLEENGLEKARQFADLKITAAHLVTRASFMDRLMEIENNYFLMAGDSAVEPMRTVVQDLSPTRKGQDYFPGKCDKLIHRKTLSTVIIANYEKLSKYFEVISFYIYLTVFRAR